MEVHGILRPNDPIKKLFTFKRQWTYRDIDGDVPIESSFSRYLTIRLGRRDVRVFGHAGHIDPMCRYAQGTREMGFWGYRIDTQSGLNYFVKTLP